MKKPFKSLGLKEEILKALEERGYTDPTEIQEKAIPFLLKNDENLIAQASTGTGKTAAFGLPILHKIPSKKGTKALIILPTRELAKQVGEELNKFAKYLDFRVSTIYGGQNISNEISELRRKPEIVIGTPGRVFDHIQRGRLVVDALDFFVLDEADEMLNMGFKEDIEEIFERTNADKTTLLFSATMPAKIREITTRFMGKFQSIKVKPSVEKKGNIEHKYYKVKQRDKANVLLRLINMYDDFYGIIFCNTKREVDELTNMLAMSGFKAEGLHGDIAQQNRERVLNKFKNRKTDILVATDVAGRGIDIGDLKYVINQSFPNDIDSYVHRSGRTGRAGNSGICMNLVTARESRSLQNVKRYAGVKFVNAEIPTVDEIREKKKNTLLEEIYNTATTDFESDANALIEKIGEKEAIKRLLNHIIEKEFNVKEIVAEPAERSRNSSNGGIRLFMKRGRKDGIGVKDILRFVTNNVKVDERKIRNIKIKDRYSFFSAPSNVAEKLTKKVGKHMIEVAKEDKSN